MHLLGPMSNEDLVLLSASPDAGAVMVREAGFKARRMGDQMHGRNTTRDEEVDIGRGHEVQRLYRQQLM